MTHRRSRLAFAIFTFLVYVLIPTKNYYWDGISFAHAIESAPQWTALFHPNHLLYNLAGFGAYRLLGRSIRALYVLQGLNALFGAMAVYAVSGIVAGITKSHATTLLLTAAFAFSGTFWRFSTDADAYILSMLLLIICARLLLLSEQPNPVFVAMVHTAAMLIHQLAFLFVPAALYILFAKRKARPRANPLLPLALYGGIAGTLTLAAYLTAFRLQTGSLSLRAFASWTTSHADDVTFSFQLLKNAGISLRSWVQLLFVGRPSIVNYADPLTVVLLTLFIGAFALFAAGIARRPATQASLPDNLSFISGNARTFHFSLIWLGAYVVFLLFWLPNNTFYKLFALPAIVFAAASYGRPHFQLNWRSPLVLAVIVMGLFNLTFAIIPYSRQNANEAVLFALELHKPLSGHAIVYFKTLNTDDWFAQYFTPAARWKPVETTQAIDVDIQRGNNVWLDTTAIDSLSKTQPDWFARSVVGARWRELVNAKHHIRFVQISPQASR